MDTYDEEGTHIEGYLLKKSPKGLSHLHVWQKRFFEARPRYLVYYKTHKRKVAIRAVRWTDIDKVVWHKDKKGGRRFDLICLMPDDGSELLQVSTSVASTVPTVTRRVFALQANTRDDAYQWCFTLNDIVEKARIQLEETIRAEEERIAATNVNPLSALASRKNSISRTSPRHKRYQSVLSTISQIKPSESKPGHKKMHSLTPKHLPSQFDFHLEQKQSAFQKQRPQPLSAGHARRGHERSRTSVDPLAGETTLVTPFQESLFHWSSNNGKVEFGPAKSIPMSEALKEFPNDLFILRMLGANISDIDRLDDVQAERRRRRRSPPRPLRHIDPSKDNDVAHNGDSHSHGQFAAYRDQPLSRVARVVLETMRKPNAVYECLAKAVETTPDMERRDSTGSNTPSRPTTPVDNSPRRRIRQTYCSEVYPLVIRIAYILIRRNHRRRGSNQDATMADIEFNQFVKDHFSGRRFSAVVYNTLLDIMVTDVTLLGLPHHKPITFFRNPVKNHGVWRAMFTALVHSRHLDRWLALRECFSLVLKQKANCLGLLHIEGWQSLMYPLLVDGSQHHKYSALMNEIRNFVMKIFSEVLYHNFFFAPKYESVLNETIDSLPTHNCFREVGAYSEHTLTLARSIIEHSIQRLCTSAKASFPLFSEREHQAWTNFQHLLHLARSFVLMTPWWRPSSHRAGTHSGARSAFTDKLSALSSGFTSRNSTPSRSISPSSTPGSSPGGSPRGPRRGSKGFLHSQGSKLYPPGIQNSVEDFSSEALFGTSMKPLLNLGEHMVMDSIHREHGLRIRERTYRLIKYQHSFSGQAAVDWIMQARGDIVKKRSDAVNILNRMLIEKLILHVTEKQSFRDTPSSLYKLGPLLQEYYNAHQDEGRDTKVAGTLVTLPTPAPVSRPHSARGERRRPRRASSIQLTHVAQFRNSSRALPNTQDDSDEPASPVIAKQHRRPPPIPVEHKVHHKHTASGDSAMSVDSQSSAGARSRLKARFGSLRISVDSTEMPFGRSESKKQLTDAWIAKSEAGSLEDEPASPPPSAHALIADVEHTPAGDAGDISSGSDVDEVETQLRRYLRRRKTKKLLPTTSRAKTHRAEMSICLPTATHQDSPDDDVKLPADFRQYIGGASPQAIGSANPDESPCSTGAMDCSRRRKSLPQNSLQVAKPKRSIEDIAVEHMNGDVNKLKAQMAVPIAILNGSYKPPRPSSARRSPQRQSTMPITTATLSPFSASTQNARGLPITSPAELQKMRSRLNSQRRKSMRQNDQDFGLHWRVCKANQAEIEAERASVTKLLKQMKSDIDITHMPLRSQELECADKRIVRLVVDLFQSLNFTESSPFTDQEEVAFLEHFRKLQMFWVDLLLLIHIIESHELKKNRIKVILMNFSLAKSQNERRKLLDFVIQECNTDVKRRSQQSSPTNLRRSPSPH